MKETRHLFHVLGSRLLKCLILSLLDTGLTSVADAGEEQGEQGVWRGLAYPCREINFGLTTTPASKNG